MKQPIPVRGWAMGPFPKLGKPVILPNAKAGFACSVRGEFLYSGAADRCTGLAEYEPGVHKS